MNILKMYLCVPFTVFEILVSYSGMLSWELFLLYLVVTPGKNAF